MLHAARGAMVFGVLCCDVCVICVCDMCVYCDHRALSSCLVSVSGALCCDVCVICVCDMCVYCVCPAHCVVMCV